MKGFDFTKTYQDLIEVMELDGSPDGFLLPAVDDYRSGTQYRTCLEAQEYWKNRNPTIEKYRRLLYTVTGSAVPDNYSADYKLASNVYFRFVTQTVQYLLGKGVRFNNPETVKRLGEDFDFKLQTALTYAINGGAAYGLMNYDRLEVFGADEFVPIYDEETGALRAGIRFWQLSEEKPLRLTLYTEDGYTEYICRNGELTVMSPKRPYKLNVGVIDGLEPIITDGGNYPCFPIVPLYSPRGQSSIVGFRRQIDCHDLIESGYANDIDDASLIYWTISNAGGMDDIDLAKFIRHMRTVRAAVVDDDGAKAEAHTVDMPYQSREAILDRLESDMYRDFMVLNTNIISSGNSTATAIKAAYEPMNLYSNMLEANVRRFIRELMKVIGISDEFKFLRSSIVNDLEKARTIQTRITTVLMLRELFGDERVKEMAENILAQES